MTSHNLTCSFIKKHRLHICTVHRCLLHNADMIHLIYVHISHNLVISGSLRGNLYNDFTHRLIKTDDKYKQEPHSWDFLSRNKLRASGLRETLRSHSCTNVIQTHSLRFFFCVPQTTKTLDRPSSKFTPFTSSQQIKTWLVQDISTLQVQGNKKSETCLKYTVTCKRSNSL